MGGEPNKLVLKNVSIHYKTKRGPFLAVSNLDLETKEGEFVSIVGSSGCGKTTTLYSIAGLHEVSSGEISVDGNPIKGPSSKRGMVFQNDSVFPWLTVFQNVAYGLKLKKLPKEKIDPIVNDHLKLVGLSNFKNVFPRELSGGMKKRVDLARAFANDPEILLMDEPFGNLDYMTKESLQLAILDLWEKAHKTVLFITHDIEEALFLSQRTIIMTGPPGKIQKVVNVPFPYPRKVLLKTSNVFQEMRADLIKSLGLSSA